MRLCLCTTKNQFFPIKIQDYTTNDFIGKKLILCKETLFHALKIQAQGAKELDQFGA